MPLMSQSRNLLSRRLAPVSRAGAWPDSVTIRRATPADAHALARLAVLDSHPRLSGEVLVAGVGVFQRLRGQATAYVDTAEATLRQAATIWTAYAERAKETGVPATDEQDRR